MTSGKLGRESLQGLKQLHVPRTYSNMSLPKAEHIYVSFQMPQRAQLELLHT